ncbi:hypothetical protein [Vallicoccus soli]|uniref:Uncharacterized protein n=1 Tax=Vallicoccus soli TaxID=2339232 RepID=A0A3A3Z1X6_9ACTN|nr:hypothetical protein [Vallicoccus soli]RJK95468.1 hypothetical protein D5H78_12550 [Vallicoccus soli]
MSTPPVGSTDLLFIAPPAAPAGEADGAPEAYDAPVRPPRSRRTRAQSGPGGPEGPEPTGPRGGAGTGPALRMLKGARQAAAGMKVSDDQIRRVLDDPQDVGPDPNQPHRTRLQRDGLVVTTGQDGMILRVARKR